MHAVMLNVSCYSCVLRILFATQLFKKESSIVFNDRPHELLKRKPPLFKVQFMWSIVPQLKMITIVQGAVYEEKSRDIVCYTSCMMLV